MFPIAHGKRNWTGEFVWVNTGRGVLMQAWFSGWTTLLAHRKETTNAEDVELSRRHAASKRDAAAHCRTT